MNLNNDKELGDLLDLNAVSEQNHTRHAKLTSKHIFFQVRSRTRFPNNTIETSGHQAVPVRPSIFFIITPFFVVLFRLYPQQSLIQPLRRFQLVK